MSQLFSAQFWAYAAERAVKTTAQSAIAVLGADVVDLLSTDWVGVVSAAVGGGILSLLTSVATLEARRPSV